MKELEFQRKLLDLVRDNGGHGFKLSNRFQGGVPDLCVTLPGLSTRLVEVKRSDRSHSGAMLMVNLTLLQRAFMRKHQDGGGLAGWLIFETTLDGGYHVWVGSDPDAETVATASKEFYIKRGALWPIKEILDYCGGLRQMTLGFSKEEG